MKLYFLRHAHAEDHHPEGDAARRLTDQGIEAANGVARLLKRLDVQPAHIYTSPRVRARHTAEIAGETLGITPEIREEVNFDFGVAALRLLVKPLRENDDLLLVGHEPTFSETIGALIGGEVVMKKSGLARVDLISREPLAGELVWLVTPKIVGALED